MLGFDGFSGGLPGLFFAPSSVFGWRTSSSSENALNEANLDVKTFLLVDFVTPVALEVLAVDTEGWALADVDDAWNVLLLGSVLLLNDEHCVSGVWLGAECLAGFGGGIEASRASARSVEDADERRTDTVVVGFLLEEYLSKSSSSLLAAARLISFASPATEDLEACTVEGLSVPIFLGGGFNGAPT
ncbi:hypothetical protein MPH_03261 [Macrophomina phaseolina MS6]|uniref:Uncharacterized protein n=1 Tax=Macrophomina phaseolina (strain MS6) TaxID=1126212 RepID=K2RXA6_MACPH|nr:hypothetical protein MPH_03261 [Macrophomina phaseolina MS6]